MSDHPDPVEEASADRARRAIERVLLSEGVSAADADRLARAWVRPGNYLADAWRLPPAQFVVGNPPYIRLEDVPSAEATAYRAAYPTMRGRADLYVAFFEAALRGLRSGGICAFICADRWMLNQYGTELRRLVGAGDAVETVVEMHKAAAFESDVSAYPAITIIRRG
ncbi:MAG: Eco57I restriction-modification methylase domain-containing protein, partial [Thermomicrobiales bacterium]